MYMDDETVKKKKVVQETFSNLLTYLIFQISDVILQMNNLLHQHLHLFCQGMFGTWWFGIVH